MPAMTCGQTDGQDDEHEPVQFVEPQEEFVRRSSTGARAGPASRQREQREQRVNASSAGIAGSRGANDISRPLRIC